MSPRLGEVWLVDMGLAGKIRPAVVVLDDQVPVERALILQVPITSQNRGTVLEVSLGHLRYLRPESVANVQGLSALPRSRFERRLGMLSNEDLERIRMAMRLAFGL